MKDNLIKIICLYYNVTEEQLLGKSRAGIIAQARLALFYVSYTKIIRNYSQISEWYNRKNHRSASELISYAKDLIDTDDGFAAQVKWISESLK